VLDEVRNVRLDLIDALANHNIFIESETIPNSHKKGIEKSLTAGLIGNLLKNTGKHGFSKVDGTKNEIAIHPGSVLALDPPSKGSYIIANEIFINPQGKTFACNCLEAKRDWLNDYAPELFPNKQKPRREHSKNAGKNGKRNHRHKNKNKFNPLDRPFPLL